MTSYIQMSSYQEVTMETALGKHTIMFVVYILVELHEIPQ